MRLALRRSVLPKPLVAMTMNLSSRSGLRKLSISGVRCRSDSSKSSATRMSSASTVQARIGSSPGGEGTKHSRLTPDRPARLVSTTARLVSPPASRGLSLGLLQPERHVHLAIHGNRHLEGFSCRRRGSAFLLESAQKEPAVRDLGTHAELGGQPQAFLDSSDASRIPDGVTHGLRFEAKQGRQIRLSVARRRRLQRGRDGGSGFAKSVRREESASGDTAVPRPLELERDDRLLESMPKMAAATLPFAEEDVGLPQVERVGLDHVHKVELARQGETTLEDRDRLVEMTPEDVHVAQPGARDGQTAHVLDLRRHS